MKCPRCGTEEFEFPYVPERYGYYARCPICHLQTEELVGTKETAARMLAETVYLLDSTKNFEIPGHQCGPHRDRRAKKPRGSWTRRALNHWECYCTRCRTLLGWRNSPN